MNVSYVRLSAAYSRAELSRLAESAREVLGTEADVSYVKTMSAQECADLHPMYALPWIGGYDGGFSSIVDLPIYWEELCGDERREFFNQSENVRTRVRTILDGWEAGDTGEFGEFSREGPERKEVTALGGGKFAVRFRSATEAEWERNRAAQMLPFPGCRQAIWDRAGMRGSIDHVMVDWAIDAVLGLL